MKSLLARCALLAALGSPAAVMAQGGAALPPADIYQELVATMFPPGAEEPYLRHMIDADLPAELRTDSGFVEMESKCPGVISAMSKAVEPVARRELENNAEVHRAAMAEMFRKDLSEQEASEANAFFASPLGRRYSAAFLDTGTSRNASAERQTQRSVSREAIEADLNEGTEAALTSLSAADRSELERIMTTVPWAIRYNGLQPAIVELNLRQQNAPQSETYSQAADAAMRKAASERLRACGIRLVQ